MIAVGEFRADRLRPGERFERGGEVWQAQTVAVSVGVPVVLTVMPAQGGAARSLSVAADERLKVVR